MVTILAPPPQYDFPPKIPVIEQVLPYETLQRWCIDSGPAPPGAHYVGCSAVSEGKCFVWVLANNAAARRHELAHCNGWIHPKGQ